MQSWNRRGFFRWGAMLAGGQALSSLTLAADAAPTTSSPDVHNYLGYIGDDGLPRVYPSGQWSQSHEDILGPYYIPGAPFRGKVTEPFAPGQALLVRGRVWSFDTKKPIPNTLLDVWQADHEGHYDKTEAEQRLEPNEFRNRIRLMTDETGYFEYETVKPGHYSVGNGTRPSHIHYLVRAFGYTQLVTQMYFKGDPFNEEDRYAKASNLHVDPEKVETPNGTYLRATCDFVLARGPWQSSSGNGSSKAEQPEQHYLPRQNSLSALDRDADGKLSSDEIDKAAEALRRLDVSGDGVLTGDELTPGADLLKKG